MLKNTYQSVIKKKTIMIFSFLILLTISITMIIVILNYNTKNQYHIIDVYAKQRMLTQKITKDAYIKYKLLEEGLDIDSINQSLVSSKNEFNLTLTSIDEELKYMNTLIQDALLEWNLFQTAIEIIIDTNQMNEGFLDALDFLTNHNNTLLEYSDQITQSIIAYQNKQTNNYIMVAIASFMISLILAVVTNLQLHKYIIAPLNEFYHSVTELGFLNKNKKLSLPTSKEIKPVVEEINNGFGKLANLIHLIQKIDEETSFEGTLKYIYQSFAPFIPYSHIGIALLTNNGDTLEASYGISDPAIKERFADMIGIRASLKDTSLGRIINEGSIRVINDLDDFNKTKDSKYNRILRNAGIKSSITLPLKLNNKPVGVIFFSSIYKNIYTKQHIAFLETLSSSIAISFNKNIFIDELIYSTILALAKMAESRDEDTGDHLDRMKLYAVKISEFLQEDNLYLDQIDHEFIKKIEKFSPMHDIGKVGVRDGILLKPGKLTPEEFTEMKKHTIYGAEVLRTAENNILKSNKSIFQFGIEIVESHHEKWDGSGYPSGKRGNDIPLSARIVAVADVLDALTSKRPYKEPFSFEESFSIIMEGKGKHFDPNIISSLIKHKQELYNLYSGFNV